MFICSAAITPLCGPIFPINRLMDGPRLFSSRICQSSSLAGYFHQLAELYSDSLSVRKNGLGRIAESDSDVRHDLLRLSYRSRTQETSRAGPRRVERGASGAPGQCDCLVERRLELRGSRHSFADRRRYRAIVA